MFVNYWLRQNITYIFQMDALIHQHRLDKLIDLLQLSDYIALDFSGYGKLLDVDVLLT